MRVVSVVCMCWAAVATAATTEVLALPASAGGDSVRVYTFDELPANCAWGETTRALYQDLGFPSHASLVPCPTSNGTMGLVPSSLADGPVEIRVRLPAPVRNVSLDAYLFDYGEFAPTLVAYDADGVEIARVSDGTMRLWTTLELNAVGSPIAEVGLLMPQLVTYVDNLVVTYGAPAPGPARPVEDTEGG